MKYLFSICTGFLIGIVVSAFTVSATIIFFSITLSIILFLEARIFERDFVRTVGFIVSILFLGIFLGQLRVFIFNNSISHDLENFESQKVFVVGKIISEPIANGQTQKLIVDVFKIILEDSSTKNIKGRILVTTDLFPEYHYGDILNIKGQLKKPEKVDEGYGKVFDYPTYLLKDKITHVISFAKITPTGENHGNILLKFLYGIKEKFVKGIQNVLPEPEAGLMAGIVLGTETLPKNLSNDFRAAGLSHIVVLSGYNITVVSNAVLSTALYFSVALAPFLAIFSVLLFVLMSGAGASAIRAGIMAIVALLGKRFGKTYHAGRALFLAAFVMVLWNPMTLLYDPSFHLSFLATLAMIYFSPIIEKYISKFKFITEKFNLRDTLATTFAVNIFVLPYILYMSGKIQILSLPANMLVLPAVSATMFLGFFVGALGMFSKILGLIAGVPSYIILYYDIFIAQTISHLSFAQISIKNFPLWTMLLIYLISSYFMYKKYKKENSSSDKLLELGAVIMTSDGYRIISD